MKIKDYLKLEQKKEKNTVEPKNIYENIPEKNKNIDKDNKKIENKIENIKDEREKKKEVKVR